MTEAAIFAFGSVIFVITTWATIAYGVASMHRLEEQGQETAANDDEPSVHMPADVHGTR